MNLLRYAAAALMSLSLVGCCCTRCVVSDPCDPCGGVISSGGCCLTKLWKSSFHRCYSWDSACGCTCGGCGCGDVIDPFGYVDGPGISGSCAAPMPAMMTGVPASSGCNCGQSAPYSQSVPYSTSPAMNGPTYLNSAPALNSQPMSAPQPIPEVPPSTQNYAPAPPASSAPAEPQTMWSPPANGQPHMVSYEEFQRLPGKMVSGPDSSAISIPAPIQPVSASSAVSTSTPGFVVPPAPIPAPIPARGPSRFVRPSSNQQAVWTPSRGN